jgi:hypothetical protein
MMTSKIKRSLLLTALAGGALFQALPGNCASFMPPSLNDGPPPTHHPLPLPPVTFNPPPPPPSSNPPQAAPPMPVTGFTAPINPKDVTDLSTGGAEQGESGEALRGIMSLSGFPSDDNSGNGDYLLARGTEASLFHKESPCSVKVESGDVLVSMRRPTRLGFVTVTFGKLALTGDADVMVVASHDILRIVNLSGRGESVKVKLDRGPFEAQNANVIALAPGYELVACSHTLGRSDVRPADGFARRSFKILEGRKIAVCEISAESVLTSSALISQIAHTDSNKERRIVADMSKMAAVLNYINGTQGFEQDSNAQVANK